MSWRGRSRIMGKPEDGSSSSRPRVYVPTLELCSFRIRVVLKNQDEEFPGNIHDMKIATVGENLSAILFGVDRTPQPKAQK